MLHGRTVDAPTAKKTGLIDEITDQGHLRRAAKMVILRRPEISGASRLKALASSGVVRPLLAKYLRMQVARRTSEAHYPVPYALIDLWKEIYCVRKSRQENSA